MYNVSYAVARVKGGRRKRGQNFDLKKAVKYGLKHRNKALKIICRNRIIKQERKNNQRKPTGMQLTSLYHAGDEHRIFQSAGVWGWGDLETSSFLRLIFKKFIIKFSAQIITETLPCQLLVLLSLYCLDLLPYHIFNCDRVSSIPFFVGVKIYFRFIFIIVCLYISYFLFTPSFAIPLPTYFREMCLPICSFVLRVLS
jgi:hypothetical protein